MLNFKIIPTLTFDKKSFHLILLEMSAYISFGAVFDAVKWYISTYFRNFWLPASCGGAALEVMHKKCYWYFVAYLKNGYS